MFSSPFPLEKQKRFLVENQGQDRSKISFVAILEYRQILHRRKILHNFLSNPLIVDTLKYCALKLSLLSTELDIASLSLLHSFHNIMHREGTNFIYSVGRFFFISFKFIFVFCNFIHVSFFFFYRLCRWLILFGTNVGLLGGVDLDLTAGKHNIQVRGLEISADQVKQTIFCLNSFNN